MPTWLGASEIKLFHRELIAEHGGLAGLKDEGALEATLARPQHLLHYHPATTLAELAASYGFGFARNHVFVDGNKRIALASVNVFLQINGTNLTASEVEVVHIILELAAGTMAESNFAEWISQNSEPYELNAE
jgi:death-on-curing protein